MYAIVNRRSYYLNRYEIDWQSSVSQLTSSPRHADGSHFLKQEIQCVYKITNRIRGGTELDNLSLALYRISDRESCNVSGRKSQNHSRFTTCISSLLHICNLYIYIQYIYTYTPIYNIWG